MSCKRAREFLAQNDIEPAETQTASGNNKLGPKDALKLAKAASVVFVAKGKKLVRYDMKKDPPKDKDLLAVMLGRSGSLRAPTVKRGKTLLVGYNADAYGDVLG